MDKMAWLYLSHWIWKEYLLFLPPLVTRKTALVITPTISLMTDQVSRLTAKGISATFLESAQTDKTIMQKVTDGIYSAVFTTPETLIDRSTGHPRRAFTKMAEEKKLALNEAHRVENLQVHITFIHQYLKC